MEDDFWYFVSIMHVLSLIPTNFFDKHLWVLLLFEESLSGNGIQQTTEGLRAKMNQLFGNARIWRNTL